MGAGQCRLIVYCGASIETPLCGPLDVIRERASDQTAFPLTKLIWQLFIFT